MRNKDLFSTKSYELRSWLLKEFNHVTVRKSVQTDSYYFFVPMKERNFIIRISNHISYREKIDYNIVITSELTTGKLTYSVFYKENIRLPFIIQSLQFLKFDLKKTYYLMSNTSLKQLKKNTAEYTKLVPVPGTYHIVETADNKPDDSAAQESVDSETETDVQPKRKYLEFDKFEYPDDEIVEDDITIDDKDSELITDEVNSIISYMQNYTEKLTSKLDNSIVSKCVSLDLNETTALSFTHSQKKNLNNVTLGDMFIINSNGPVYSPCTMKPAKMHMLMSIKDNPKKRIKSDMWCKFIHMIPHYSNIDKGSKKLIKMMFQSPMTYEEIVKHIIENQNLSKFHFFYKTFETINRIKKQNKNI